MIYLDNAATTFPKPESVYRTLDEFNRTSAVNIGRGSYRSARQAGQLETEAKQMLLNLCDAKRRADVIFTPSSTIAINQVIRGYRFHPGDIVYVSPYEHNAVLRTLFQIKKKKQIRIRELPLLPDCAIDPVRTEAAFRKHPPAFVSVTAVSNVTGYVLPYAQIFAEAKKYRAFTLLDASQALGLVRISHPESMADAIIFAGHKTLYGPFGIGGFLLKKGIRLKVVLTGGNGIRSLDHRMPESGAERYECGSKNSPAIAGLHAALPELDVEKLWEQEQELTQYLITALASIPGIVLYPAPEPALQAGVVSFNLQGWTCAETAAVLDRNFDIAVRAGHHCCAGIHKYLKNDVYGGTVRASIGRFNTKEDVDQLVQALHSMTPEMKAKVPDNILRACC